MKKESSMLSVSAGEGTNPVLVKAASLIKTYEKATGAFVCVQNSDCTPISELFREMTDEKNICLFCIKYRRGKEVKCPEDLSLNPCGDLHINAVNESRRSGVSHSYSCGLGFVFWTSPIFLNSQFAGAFTSGGFLNSGADEVCARMRDICKGELSDAELKRMLAPFPRAESRRIQSLAELLLVCARSVSKEIENLRAEQQPDISGKIEDLKNLFPAEGPGPEYPFDKERRLLEIIKMGDAQLCKEILNEILAVVLFANSGSFKYIQCRAMELAVLLSRTDTGRGCDSEFILEANQRYFKSIQEAQNAEEVTERLYRIVDEIAEKISAFKGMQHASALKKAEYYILKNFTRKISLDEIAKAAGFSAPYFSTIFKDGVGENLSVYINRLRVEKAGYMLISTDLSLAGITKACGFGDQSWFSKIFKTYTGTSPGKFRNQGGKPAVKKT